MRRVPLLLAPLALSGCVQTLATAAVDVVTLPVKVVSAGVDAVTTSQSERDAQLGKQLRRQDEERGRLYREAQERCRKGRPLPTDDCSAVRQR